jgi:hypothetical protein
LANYLLLKEENYTVLKSQRDASQPLYAVCIQLLIKAIISKREFHLLDDLSSNGFRVSINWIREFIKAKLN